MRRAGFTLIEIMITLAIIAISAATVTSAVSALTDANLRGDAISLTGAVKTSYDRAVMLNRPQRMVFNLDAGTWWIEYADQPFSLTAELTEGEDGEQEIEDLNEAFDLEEETDAAVKAAIVGSKGVGFKPDADIDAGKPQTLSSGVCFNRVWTGHQEEAFRAGVAHLHFWPGGWTEDARIELIERSCEDKRAEISDSTYLTLRVLPLTGRVRSYHRRMEEQDAIDYDGFEDGDL